MIKETDDVYSFLEKYPNIVDINSNDEFIKDISIMVESYIRSDILHIKFNIRKLINLIYDYKNLKICNQYYVNLEIIWIIEDITYYFDEIKVISERINLDDIKVSDYIPFKDEEIESLSIRDILYDQDNKLSNFKIKYNNGTLNNGELDEEALG